MSDNSMRQNPWIVAGASTFALIAGGLPLIVFTFSVFLKPIVEETGWSRGTAAAGISLYLYLLAFTSPLMGLAVDRLGVRKPLIASILATVATLAALSTVSALPVFLVLFAILGLVSAGLTPVPYSKVVVSWFDKQRGLALGVVNAGQGIGGAILPLVASYLLVRFGWRGGYLGLAVVLLVVALPGALLIVREHPQVAIDRAARAAAAGASDGGYREILKAPAFWIITVTTLALSLGTNGVFPHMVALLTDRGLTLPVAAGIMSAIGLAGIAGRIGTGFLVDLFFAPYVAVVVFVVTAFGLVGLWLGAMPPVVCAILLGAGLGAELDLMGYLTSRYFSRQLFARVYGLVFFSMMMGQALGAFTMGICFDLTRSYNVMLIAFAVIMFAGGFLSLRLGPYVYKPGEGH